MPPLPGAPSSHSLRGYSALLRETVAALSSMGRRPPRGHLVEQADHEGFSGRQPRGRPKARPVCSLQELDQLDHGEGKIALYRPAHSSITDSSAACRPQGHL